VADVPRPGLVPGRFVFCWPVFTLPREFDGSLPDR